MEASIKGENATRELNPQEFSHNFSRNSGELDFSDVFGGPPRRLLMEEVRMRYSFSETAELEVDGLSSLKEKPVFGGQRRRNVDDDFFDDIFRGDESYNYVFGLSPRSMIFSPATNPLLHYKTEALPTFPLPAQFSEYKMDSSTNGLSRPQYSSIGSLSKFSNEAVRGQDEIRNEVYRVHCQSSFSHEASFSSEVYSCTATSDQNNVGDLEKDRKSVDSSGNRFHFSIFRWGGRGVPMAMPLVNKLKSKDISQVDRCKPSTVTNEALSAKMKPESLRIEREMEDSKSKEEIEELQCCIEEAFYGIPESKSCKDGKHAAVFAVGRRSTKAGVISLDEISMTEKTEKEVYMKMEESLMSEVKPLHGFLTDEVKQPDSLYWDSKILDENSDYPFEDNFLVQELSDDLEEAAQNIEVFEDMKALDAKIRQWSEGKKGNIRSLLSTLQYILWPGNKWKPIPLVDLVEANSVKKAYQKALLHLHPDKLQQKCTASHHKFIAGKVFDILQEAWDHFNTLAPL